jgi:hypothetical protein
MSTFAAAIRERYTELYSRTLHVRAVSRRNRSVDRIAVADPPGTFDSVFGSDAIVLSRAFDNGPVIVSETEGTRLGARLLAFLIGYHE